MKANNSIEIKLIDFELISINDVLSSFSKNQIKCKILQNNLLPGNNIPLTDLISFYSSSLGKSYLIGITRAPDYSKNLTLLYKNTFKIS